MNQLSLKQEVTLLRSAVIGLVAKDREGQYRPEFVMEMFSSTKRTPTTTFNNAEQFLAEISKS